MKFTDPMPGITSCTASMNMFSKALPDTGLYHYTSKAGLLGMAANKKLWYTDYAYLNDTEEFKYAIRILNQVLEEYSETGMIKMELTQEDLPPAYTFSISRQGDLLSQWRGYCRDGGYCLELNSAQLQAMITRNRFLVGECLYEVEDQKALIRKMLPYDAQSIMTSLRERRATNVGMWRAEIMHCIQVNSLWLLLIKHPAFREEAEWRIISPNGGRIFTGTSLAEEIKYREGSSTPYIEVFLPNSDDGSLLLDSVIVSPTTMQKSSEEARYEAEQIVETYGCCKASAIRKSTIPYRG